MLMTRSRGQLSLCFGRGDLLTVYDLSSDMSSFSNKTMQVTVYDRAFVSQNGISALTTTSTKFGVTAKDIICVFLHPVYIPYHSH